MNGKVLPDTPIAVDFWQLRKCHHVRLFFLSHMHADHTSGLSSTWSHRPLYCSPLTAKLLQLKLKVKEKWIRPLEIGEAHMLFLDDLGKERLTVTLIDANHCPGAVMFLFEGYFGTILYTGDFRYTPSMLREQCLRNTTTIDVLYLDNTNCDPTRAVPSRQQATQQIKEIIRTHPGYAVVIGLYSLGKESLLVELAVEFKTWVEVDRERLETLRVLELPDVFTTDSGAGRIRVVAQSMINASNLYAWNKVQPTIAILPTSRPMVSCHTNVYVVAYSDHSSYQELEDFVSALCPISLLPIVGNCLPYFSSLLNPCRKKPKEVVIPESVKHYMMTNSNIQTSTNGITDMLQSTLHPGSRGVVFESPESKISKLSHDDGDSETDQDSNCILLDMSTNFYSQENGPPNKRLKPIQVASEDVVKIGSSLPSDDNESISTLIDARSPDRSSVYECEHASPTKSSKEKSPQMGSTNSRERCSSMDSISTHDQTCVTGALTPPETRSVTSTWTFTLQREQIEQLLLENFTIPAEQLKGDQVSWGIREENRLTPVDLPNPAGDPLEAAIKTFTSKCD
ncbi:5' exonuclease Apollo-like [Cyprinus carpio]|uniref:5' exonuclease Apollo n=1 Tax=Cyprinus carpio TaxID=7962 RepID=A0A8C1K739_CYPCA|nr:5' exonuclease Apollo-like [Cyprinus carpio]XP_018970687.1 5' exonuclease Apollo-like [Cyprinus carpio]